MKIISFLFLILFFVGCGVSAQIDEPVEVYFSPKGGCTDTIVANINRAQNTIFVQAYSFTSKPIAQALKNAKSRNVEVYIILDKSNRYGRTLADSVVSWGIETYCDAKHSIAHNKIIIIDSNVVLTGSFNFSSSAEYKNAENLVVIRLYSIVNKYKENWFSHRTHSTLWGQ
jgi:phosphatidylserine/phosphatidylglycerophosphate/cardiolipin synthase-like enzyme